MRQDLFGEFEEVLQLFIIAAASIGAILSSVYSLTHGITEVFPFLYILPIILVIYFYPKRAVIFALSLSVLYISLVFLLSSGDTETLILATAWFAIFMTISVVAASYANNLLEERNRIRHIIDNSQDGLFCFDPAGGQILDLNSKFAKQLRYERAELVGRSISRIWPDEKERTRFTGMLLSGQLPLETEILFRARDGSVLRFIISPLESDRSRILCSAIDITGDMIADEEIRRTLEDLEGQVRARTAHLEQLNEQLKAEILEHRRYEVTMLPDRAGTPVHGEGRR